MPSLLGQTSDPRGAEVGAGHGVPLGLFPEASCVLHMGPLRGGKGAVPQEPAFGFFLYPTSYPMSWLWWGAHKEWERSN